MLQPLPWPESCSDVELATSLTKLWPNREHESNALTCLCCRFGCIAGVSSIWKNSNLIRKFITASGALNCGLMGSSMILDPQVARKPKINWSSLFLVLLTLPIATRNNLG